ncbi:hypothetical protein D3C81_1847560 [compost metagenome]
MGFFHAETQGVSVDFQQPAMRPEPAQPQVRRIARGDGQEPARGQGVQQLADEIQHLGAVQHLEFVEEDDEGLLALGDLVEQGRRPGRASRAFDANPARQVEFAQTGIQVCG